MDLAAAALTVSAPILGPNKYWMVVRTRPLHKEKEAQEALQRAGFEVYLPKLKLIKGRKCLEKRYLYPNRLFVRFVDDFASPVRSPKHLDADEKIATGDQEVIASWQDLSVLKERQPAVEPDDQYLSVLKCWRVRDIIRPPRPPDLNSSVVRKPFLITDKAIKKLRALEHGGFIIGLAKDQKVRAQTGHLVNQIGKFVRLSGNREFAAFDILGKETVVEFQSDVLEAVA